MESQVSFDTVPPRQNEVAQRARLRLGERTAARVEMVARIRPRSRGCGKSK